MEDWIIRSLQLIRKVFKELKGEIHRETRLDVRGNLDVVWLQPRQLFNHQNVYTLNYPFVCNYVLQ